MSATPAAPIAPAGLGQNVWAAAGAAFVVALIFRAALILSFPIPFAYDGYERWLGRGFVLVQDWLPVTQSFIWAAAQLGAGLTETRLVMALVGATAAFAGAWAAVGLAGGDRRAAWWWLPISVFGGFASWTTVFYQEGTFIAIFYAGVAFALHGRLRLADLTFGLLGLVRYEGWPFILLYIAWRRDMRASLALWGIGLWIGMKLGGVSGHRPSPVDFQDWNGIVERFDVDRQVKQTVNLVIWSFQHGCMVPFGAALVEARWSRLARLLFVLFAVQLGITEAWLAGLETGTSRMLVVPTMLVAPAAAALGVRLQGRLRVAGIIGVVIFAFSQLPAAIERCSHEADRISPELRLARAMQACEGCVWWIDPRLGLGTRKRHDGCQVLAGVTEYRAGVDFFCAGWQDAAASRAAFASCTNTARWDGFGYRAVQHGLDSSRYGPPPSLAPAPDEGDERPE